MAVSQLYYTRAVSLALRSQGHKGLQALTATINQQMTALVKLVRGDLSKLHRLTLGALIVVDVHARDVLAKLVKDGVSHDNNFEWLAQLRYYWEANKAYPTHMRGLGPTGLESSPGTIPDEGFFCSPLHFLFSSSPPKILFLCIISIHRRVYGPGRGADRANAHVFHRLRQRVSG